MQKLLARDWFESIQKAICDEFEAIERCVNSNAIFEIDEWTKPFSDMQTHGSGKIMIMKGNVFESVAVNTSCVEGVFTDKLFDEMKKSKGQFTESENLDNKNFWASGVSLIAHMKNPHVPAVHMNTIFLMTGNSFWFGGGMDLTPLYELQEDNDYWHNELKIICDKHNPDYYTKFKKQCDDYFYLPHRKEHRGIGGIFYDYLNNNNFESDFDFTKDVGLCLLKTYSALVRKNMFLSYTDEDREKLFYKRGRYVEFNLLYDRGTRFGLMTGGNPKGILASLPPIVKWSNKY